MELCRRLRRDLLEISFAAKSNHLGPNLSLVELMGELWDFLEIGPENFGQKNRDYFILSKGHAALIYYLVLAHKGFFTIQELKKSWHQNGGPFCEHPLSTVPGVDVSTGSLGHGPAISVGLALGLRELGGGHKVTVVLGDGECGEGSVWEAAWSAVKEKLGNLLWVVDANGLQGLGSTESISFERAADKFRAFGWKVEEVDGHNQEKIRAALLDIRPDCHRPHMIFAHTIKGKGVSFMERNNLWHYRSLNQEEFALAMKELS